MMGYQSGDQRHVPANYCRPDIRHCQASDRGAWYPQQDLGWRPCRDDIRTGGRFLAIAGARGRWLPGAAVLRRAQLALDPPVRAADPPSAARPGPRRAFPTCGMSGAGNSASHQWASAPGYCPPQYTRVFDGASGPVYTCDYTGAVTVTVEGAVWARTWWGIAGDTVTEFTPAAKAQLGTWDTKFDDDYASLARVAAAAGTALPYAAEASHGRHYFLRPGAGLRTAGARQHGAGAGRVESGFNP